MEEVRHHLCAKGHWDKELDCGQMWSHESGVLGAFISLFTGTKKMPTISMVSKALTTPSETPFLLRSMWSKGRCCK